MSNRRRKCALHLTHVCWTHLGRILGWLRAGLHPQSPWHSSHRLPGFPFFTIHSPTASQDSFQCPAECAQGLGCFQNVRKCALVTIIIDFTRSAFSFRMPQVPQFVFSCVRQLGECSMFQVTQPWSCTAELGPGGALNPRWHCRKGRTEARRLEGGLSPLLIHAARLGADCSLISDHQVML